MELRKSKMLYSSLQKMLLSLELTLQTLQSWVIPQELIMLQLPRIF